MIIKFCENLLLRIRERKAAYEGKLLSGSLKDMEEYKFMSGYRKGLEESEEIARQLYSDMFEIKKGNKEEYFDDQ